MLFPLCCTIGLDSECYKEMVSQHAGFAGGGGGGVPMMRAMVGSEQSLEILWQERYQKEQDKLKEEWEKAQKEVEEEERRYYEEVGKSQEGTGPRGPRFSKAIDAFVSVVCVYLWLWLIIFPHRRAHQPL